MEYFILNDPNLSFKEVLQRHLCGEPLVEKRPEKAPDRKPEMVEPKPEEEAESKAKKSDSKKEKRKGEEKDKEKEKMEVEEEVEDKEKEKKEKEKKETDKDKDEKKEEEPEVVEVKEKLDKTKEKADEDKRKKKEDERSMPAPTAKPDRRKVSVSIQPPHITLQQMEQMITSGGKYDVELMNDLMAQTYAAAIKWPKDVILQVRLEHIMKHVETGVWPVPKNYPLADHLMTSSRAATPDREASTPMSEASEVSFDEPSPARRRRSRHPVPPDENPIDHSPKIRSLLTSGPTVTPPKNPVALSLDAFLLESNQQNLAER
jgi:hypothetical protein